MVHLLWIARWSCISAFFLMLPSPVSCAARNAGQGSKYLYLESAINRRVEEEITNRLNTLEPLAPAMVPSNFAGRSMVLVLSGIGEAQTNTENFPRFTR